MKLYHIIPHNEICQQSSSKCPVHKAKYFVYQYCLNFLMQLEDFVTIFTTNAHLIKVRFYNQIIIHLIKVCQWHDMSNLLGQVVLMKHSTILVRVQFATRPSEYSHCLLRLIDPNPQVTEQLLQGPHSPQPPREFDVVTSTEKMDGKITSITKGIFI